MPEALETGAQRSASTWAVGVFLTAGAFGWLPDLRADFAFHMPALELGPFHGDPVPAMTPAMALLAPMVPRDLGLALSPVLLWAAVTAARRFPSLLGFPRAEPRGSRERSRE